MNSDEKMHQMLEMLYPEETVPEDVKIRLQNQLACRAMMKDHKISFWWLPALLSTVVAVAGFAIYMIFYMVVRLNDTHFIMPNLMNWVTTGMLKAELIGAVLQVTASWLFTVVGVWKLNFRKKAHIF